MSRLEINAVVENSLSAAGNTNPVYIVVSVVDNNGAGVVDLKASHFTLCSEIIGNCGVYSHISSVSSVNSGVYVLRVLPLTGQTWKAGVYVYSVVVHHGVNRGQTLCKFCLN
jgi:hypothetical protein